MFQADDEQKPSLSPGSLPQRPRTFTLPEKWSHLQSGYSSFQVCEILLLLPQYQAEALTTAVVYKRPHWYRIAQSRSVFVPCVMRLTLFFRTEQEFGLRRTSGLPQYAGSSHKLR